MRNSGFTLLSFFKECCAEATARKGQTKKEGCVPLATGHPKQQLQTVQKKKKKKKSKARRKKGMSNMDKGFLQSVSQKRKLITTQYLSGCWCGFYLNNCGDGAKTSKCVFFPHLSDGKL